MRISLLLPLAIFAVGLLFIAASPADCDTATTKPYWAKPKAYWTPANAQQQLRVDAEGAQCVRIYGGGSLWHTLTGLPTDATVIKHSPLAPEAKGIIIRDRRLIHRFPALLHHSTRVLGTNSLVQADKLDIQFIATRGENSTDEAMFMWWEGKAYCYRPMIGALEMEPKSGNRLDTFIRQMSQYARSHHKGVSFFRYNIYSLSPS